MNTLLQWLLIGGAMYALLKNTATASSPVIDNNVKIIDVNGQQIKIYIGAPDFNAQIQYWIEHNDPTNGQIISNNCEVADDWNALFNRAKG